MKVKFKSNPEPCIQYEIEDDTPVLVFDEILQEECECIHLKVMGLTPLHLLEAASCPNNIDAIDLLIELKNELA